MSAREMTNLGRLIGVLAAVLLVIGAAVFLFIRSSFFSEGLYQVKTAVGLDTAALERHVVPADFKGWAVVHFAVKDAPPLREDDGALIVEYPASGRLDTSNPAPDDLGFLHRAYYRREAGGLVPLSRAGDIWGEFSHVSYEDDWREISGRSSGFFVGTMTEFLATEWPAEHNQPIGVRE